MDESVDIVSTIEKPAKKWIPKFNKATALRIKGYYDHKPEPNKCYFGLDDLENLHSDNRDLPILIIAVAFYNESAIELLRTLVSLADQVEELRDYAICQVVFVSDGHRQMSDDAKEFFRHIFCTNKEESDNWKKLMKRLDSYCEAVDAANEDERRGTPIAQAKKKPDHLTFVVQKVGNVINNDGTCGIARLDVEIPGAEDFKLRKLPLSLIVKASNRRKHNSHEWVLNSFAKQGVVYDRRNSNIDDNDRRYIFLSDCGTSYDPECLFGLVSYMNDHPLCVGCTGRQRVMSAKEQNDNDEGFFSISKFFRIIQLADYEASYAIYTAAFAAVGCLSVLPGPCAMFRYSGLLAERKFRAISALEIALAKEITNVNPRMSSSDIISLGRYELSHSESCENMSSEIFLRQSESSPSSSPNFVELEEIVIDTPEYVSINLVGQERSKESALHHYSSLVATPPEETDLVRENVKIAEDRIPSYAVVTHGKKGAYTTWVPGPTFKFQAETDLRSFVLQRRRWINGAFLCYIWNTLVKPHLILGSNHNPFRKIMIYILFFTQLINYVLAAISPAIFCSALYLALVSLLDVETTASLAIVIIYGLLLVLFMWVHRYIVFVKPLFYLLVVVNAVGMCIVFAGYIKQAIKWNFMPEGIDHMIIQWSTIAIITMPFIMALIALDFKSFGYLLIACIPYWLFLPTLVGTFTIYALSRLSDTTWGNRVSVAGSNFKGASQKQIADLQADLSSNASVALVFVTLANLIIGIVVIWFHSNSWFIVGCMMALFSTIGLQISISIIYFAVKHISCTTCRECSKKSKIVRKAEMKRKNRIANVGDSNSPAV